MGGTGATLAASYGAQTASWVGLLRDGVRFCTDSNLATESWARVRQQQIELAQAEPTSMEELLLTAEAIVRKLGSQEGSEFHNWVRRSIGGLKISDRRLPEAVCRLGVPILTTNYDDILEQVGNFDPLTFDDHEAFYGGLPDGRRGVVHVHGHWRRPRTIVLDVLSYSAIDNNKLAAFHLQKLMSDYSLLFIGVNPAGGLSDPHFTGLRRWFGDVHFACPHHHYVLVPASEHAEALRVLMPDGRAPRDHIYPVSYGADKQDLPLYLERLVPAPQQVPAVAVPASPLAPSASGDASTLTRNGLVFVRIPAGPFLMGSHREQVTRFRNEEQSDHCLIELPQHEVPLDEYWISKCPITQQEYERFIKANPGWHVPSAADYYSRPYAWDPHTRTCPRGRRDHPVVLVSWADAREYCRWCGFRLPTEAEWEKAARGCEGLEFPWGEEWRPGCCNSAETGLDSTCSVSEFMDGLSPYGVAGMAGNGWGWCSSLGWHHTDASRARRAAPAGGGLRVTRGGGFDQTKLRQRCAYRGSTHPGQCGYSLGFRVVLCEL